MSMSISGRILFGVGLLGCVAGLSAAEPAPPKAQVPDVKSVSGPFTHGNLTIYLLHGPDVMPGKTILTLQEGLAQKTAVVHETSDVNELAVENNSADALLFIQSGDIVKGGKQDRAIAFDMLLPPKSGRVALGSFCVEHGRWQQRGGEAFAMFGSCTDQIIGKDLKAAVIGNRAEKQGDVWKEVSKAQMQLASNVGGSVAAAASPSSLQLSLENKQVQEKLTAYEKAIAGAVEGKSDVIGMALCVNGKVEGAEVYGSAALFGKLWPKLLKSAATDALAQLDDKKKFDPATAKAVETFLADAAAGPAKEVPMAAAGGRQMANNLAADLAVVAQAPAQPPAAANPPARVRIVRYDGGKVLLVESQDKENASPIVLHRCYIAK
jgi:hypothetical protein